MWFKYQHYYNLAIEKGAEDTMTALQMVVACQNLSNVSIEDIQKRTIEMFILNKKEGLKDEKTNKS
jgi:hypothetical protein